ncbi:hypothetical protein MKZ38_003120 [Zalerion maritima]|uniref:Signal peptidase complex subunit 2 n=1 Tax=Zalerion maritima TaxID=339359 RepID=A0AAD5RWT4_9PEZI|nr:hypothetical protein MKZ38_003120 [Zalerion maritima]
MSSDKIAVYNLADLKGTSDDALPNYLNSLKFAQSHKLVDVRLALGYTAFAISAVCFAWDYKLGFENTKLYTTIAVALYTIINGILTLWIMFKEKGIVYVGTAPSGETITISSSTTKNVPIYNITVTLSSPKKGVPDETINISRSFAEWFDVTGAFIATPFQSMLASSVELVGKSDPKRVAGTSKNESESNDMSPEMIDAVLTATGTEAAAPSGKKGGKRRKA